MGTERKRKVSLFDVMDDPSAPAKTVRNNGIADVNSLINKWNGKPYSQKYYEILEKRRTLPVWLQKEEFLKTLNANQTLILVGETGSGKTTQVKFSSFPFPDNSYLINCLICRHRNESFRLMLIGDNVSVSV